MSIFKTLFVSGISVVIAGLLKYFFDLADFEVVVVYFLAFIKYALIAKEES